MKTVLSKITKRTKSHRWKFKSSNQSLLSKKESLRKGLPSKRQLKK